MGNIKDIADEVRHMLGYFKRKRAKAWQHYRMFEPYPGTKVYRFIPPAGSDTPVHDACPNCRKSDGGISILQYHSGGEYRCPACGERYRFHATPAKPRRQIISCV